MKIDQVAMDALCVYRGPGNGRELQNVIERAVVLSSGPTITVADLPAEVQYLTVDPERTREEAQGIDPALPLAEATAAFKRVRIRQAPEAAAGNRTKAAQLLGLLRPNLFRLRKSLGM